MRRRVKASISFVRINCLSAVFMAVFLSVCLKSADFGKMTKLGLYFHFEGRFRNFVVQRDEETGSAEYNAHAPISIACRMHLIRKGFKPSAHTAVIGE